MVTRVEAGDDLTPRAATPLPTLPHKGGGEKPAHAPVTSGKRQLAKNLRRHLTPAERKLWHALKAHRFQGLHFRRQVPIGPYIADFLCHEAKLVIEVDGAQHGFTARAQVDRKRDRWFASQGYKVLRFCNADVLKETTSVLDTIYAHMPHRTA